MYLEQEVVSSENCISEVSVSALWPDTASAYAFMRAFCMHVRAHALQKKNCCFNQRVVADKLRRQWL